MRDDDGEDFVLWALRELVDAFPAISTVAWLELEIAMRRRFGGLRPYIPKHPRHGSMEWLATREASAKGAERTTDVPT
jgi:hypothetical protein